MAVKTEQKTEAQERAERQAIEHRESVAAINAAEAVLLPLGFIRRKEKEYFNFSDPGRVEAEWNLAENEIRAHISRQAKGWNQGPVCGGDGSYYYRVVLSARHVYGMRDPRLAPGNRPGVLAYIEKVKEKLAEDAAYAKKLERLTKDAKSLIVNEFPNLTIKKIEVDHDDLVMVRVQTKTGGTFYLSLDGSLNFMGLTVSEDGEASRPIGRSLKRALGAL